MIGTMTVTPKLLPHTGDRDDYIVDILGPEPSTPKMSVPLSFTGTVLAIWKVDSKKAAEEIARTIFGGGEAVIGTIGTASGFPKQGYWFDSYNSGDSLEETINKILNKGDTQFIKNRSSNGIYGLLIGEESGDILENIDKFFNEKFKIDFFKKLDEVFALSEIADTLAAPPQDNANFLYKVCLLSSIIDAISVRLESEKGFYCPGCKRTVVSSIAALKNWLIPKVGEQKAQELVEPLKMIRKIRNQFPIHNHYESKNGIRVASKAITSANDYFKFTKDKDFTTKWNIILAKFNCSFLDIIAALK